jgi:hypothetical protein
MIAAGWSEHAVAEQVIAMLTEWFEVLHGVLSEAEEAFGGLGPFSAEDVAMLVGMAFLGGESLLLLGDPRWSNATRGALRRVGDLIRLAETGG